MNKLYLLGLVGLMAGTSVLADVIGDAKATRSTYFGSMQIDSYNPGKLDFETMIANQQVELTINTVPLNTTALPVILNGQASFSRKRKCNVKPDTTCPNPDVVEATPHQLAVFINDCNISSEVVRLCGLLGSDCDIGSPTVFPASLGSYAIMNKAVVLNAVDFTALASSSAACQKLKGFKFDTKYKLQFRELLNETNHVATAAGRVIYNLEVFNHAYASSKNQKI